MFCKYFEIPAPAPPVVPGAFLVVAMTFGYVVGDKVLPKKSSSTNSVVSAASATQTGNEKNMPK